MISEVKGLDRIAPDSKRFKDYMISNRGRESDQPISDQVLRDVVRANLSYKVPASLIYLSSKILPKLLPEDEQRSLFERDYFDSGWKRIKFSDDDFKRHYASVMGMKNMEFVTDNIPRRHIAFQRVSKDISKVGTLERIYLPKSILSEKEELEGEYV